MSKTPIPADADEIADLPPLDGEVDDPADSDVEIDPEESDASLDDSTGPADAAGDDDLDGIDEGEGSWLNEDADSEDLELGDGDPPDLDAEGTFLGDSEEPDARDDDDLPGDSALESGLDSGDEGPIAPDDELREEDLPALDADDEGDVDDSLLVDAGFAGEEPVGLPWAAEPWARVGAPLDLVFATAVACVGRGALVAVRAESGGPELSRIDLEGSREALVAAGADRGWFSTLAAREREVAGVLADGRLVVSHDGGSTFEPVALDGGVADAVFTSRSLWLRSASGRWLVSSDGGRTLDSCEVPGTVVAIAPDGIATCAALVVDGACRPVALVRGTARAGGAAVVRETLAGPPAAIPACLAVRGGHVAYASPAGVVRRTAAGTCRSFAWEGCVTAVTFVDDDGTLVAATYSAAEDTTGIVRLDGDGRAAVVARIGASLRRDPVRRGDGRVVALARDDARGVVWTVGDFGVAAFAIAPR